MVKKATYTVDEGGQQKVKLYTLTNNSAESYLCDPEQVSVGEIAVKVKDLKPGDILYLAVSGYDNTIESFQIRYLVSTDKVYNNASANNKNQFATF